MPRRNQGPRLRWLDKRGRYYITWTERGRSRQRSTGTADRGEAEAVFVEWMNARRSPAGPQNPAEVLVTDVLNWYATERGPKVADAARLGHAVDALASFWEIRTVADVTPWTCDAYERHRAPCSAGTVRRELGVLRAALNYAHRYGYLTRPVAVELPASPVPRDRWLTRDEAAALLRASLEPQVRLYLPLYILLALYTGRRKSAILELRWPQVDLENGTIDFDTPGRKRTNKRRGRIPIPPRLVPHLRRARRRGSELGYVVHDRGRPIRDIKKGFAAACRRAGIEGVTPHSLRHTAATWIARDSATTLEDAADFLGMSVDTLRNVYRHHHPDFLRQVAASIGRRPRNVRAIGRRL